MTFDTWIEFSEWLCSISSWFDVAGHDLLSGRACGSSVSDDVGGYDFISGRTDRPAVGHAAHPAIVSARAGRVVNGCGEPEDIRRVLLDVAGTTAEEGVTGRTISSNVWTSSANSDD